MVNPAPVIGDWYRRPSGETFEVVALDPDDRTIEIQFFDGTVGELDLEQWLEYSIETTEAPEDWTGSVDIEPEDCENEIESAPSDGHHSGDPLFLLDRGEALGYSEFVLPESPDDFDR